VLFKQKEGSINEGVGMYQLITEKYGI